MGETRKPRNIRDIAHLYISSHRNDPAPPSALVLIAGDGRDCLSGFHAANLAGSLAGRGIRVTLFERSGLLPNAGYFMASPPRCYLPWVEFESDCGTVFGGVRIDVGEDAFTASGSTGGTDGPRIDIVHLPPVYPLKPLRKALRAARTLDGDVTVFLMLRIKETPPGKFARLVEDELGPTVTCVLRLDGTDAADSGDPTNVFDLGHLAGWKRGAGDRIPAVIRDPDSALAREFASIAEALLLKIGQSRRTAGADGAARRRSG